MITETKTTDAGPTGLLPRGNYSSTASYMLLHTVLYNHDSWVCKAVDQNGDAVEITGIAPEDNSPYWQALTDGGRAAVAVGTQVRSDFDAWFGATANAGIRKTVTDWLAARQTEFYEWFGATANAGIRKTVADWMAARQTQFTEWFSDTLTSGVRYIWTHWFSSTQSEWGSLKTDATTATTRANNASAIAEELNAHPPYIADGTQEKPGDVNFWYLWDYISKTYLKGPYAKGDNLDLSTITEEEYDRLVEQIRQSMVLASYNDGANIVRNYGNS